MKTTSKQAKRRDPHPHDLVVRQANNKLSFQTTMNKIIHSILHFGLCNKEFFTTQPSKMSVIPCRYVYFDPIICFEDERWHLEFY